MREIKMVQDITGAALAIINSREMCGNEREALRDWEAENGKLDAAGRAMVTTAVARLWASYQTSAGVTKPISPAERKRINRALED